MHCSSAATTSGSRTGAPASTCRANEWTLDQAAIHDHPAAVRKVVEETGAEKVKAIIHCQGSTSFMMSALAGLVPEVDDDRRERGLAPHR